MTRTRIDEPGIRKAQILAAAEEALAERGYHNLQLDDIARRAKVAKGTLYLYFKNKEDLLLGLAEKIALEHDRQETAMKVGGSMERLRHLVLFKIRWLRSHYDLFAAISLLKPELYGKRAARAIRESFQRSLRHAADLIQEGVRERKLRPHDPMAGALYLLSLFRMAELEMAFLPKRRSPEKMRDLILDCFLNGLGVRS